MENADLSWIEQLHTRLALRYADKWLRMWEGFDMEAVRCDWAHVLEGVTTAGLLYALDNLPAAWPPTAGEFLEIVRRQPSPNEAQPALSGSPADPKRVASLLAKLARPQPVNRLAWAYRLRDAEKAGERLTEAQKTAWRRAFDMHPSAEVEISNQSPMPSCP